MPRKLKLDDLHLILLSTASQRDDGSVLPVAESIAGDTDRISTAVTQLLNHRLIVEVPTIDAPFGREEGDDGFGLIVTDAGYATIGVAPRDSDAHVADILTEPAPQSVTPPSPPTKSATVIALLQRDDGATLPQLIAVTGWLPHTTRAALTGLRKKGHAIDRSKVAGVTTYRIASAA